LGRPYGFLSDLPLSASTTLCKVLQSGISSVGHLWNHTRSSWKSLIDILPLAATPRLFSDVSRLTIQLLPLSVFPPVVSKYSLVTGGDSIVWVQSGVLCPSYFQVSLWEQGLLVKTPSGPSTGDIISSVPATVREHLTFRLGKETKTLHCYSVSPTILGRLASFVWPSGKVFYLTSTAEVRSLLLPHESIVGDRISRWEGYQIQLQDVGRWSRIWSSGAAFNEAGLPSMADSFSDHCHQCLEEL
jgi:hypothetical protein